MSPISDAKNLGTCLASAADQWSTSVAIVERDTHVCFGPLNTASTAIARGIVAASAGRTGVVSLLFESRLRTVTAIFGACKSGSAYVVLNADDPDERLRFVLRDSAAVMLLTESALRGRAQAIVPADCVVLDIEHALEHDDGPVLPDVSSEAAACIYYTSGSTGVPKGVVQTHRSLLHITDVYGRALGLGAGDRLSLLNSLSFAAANGQVFRGLLNGATLCAYDLRSDGLPQLADWLDRERVSVLHTAPSVFRALAKRLPPDRLLPHLRAIHLGGESVFAGDVELFRRHTLEHCVLVNQLASSEAGVIAQKFITHRMPAMADGVVPVGRVTEGTRVEIRRPDGSAADIDEVGTMIVCGPHVSPGYWRRPELDAAVFSVHPDHPNWRQYRSGDLGWLDAAGDLHFLGREGSRIKIHGHSIDLMEIEAALATCPEVTQSAVVAGGGESEAAQVRLVAYVSLRDGADRAPSRIRNHLAKRLPTYMLPGRIVFLDALPLTATGKVNRAELSMLDATSAAPARPVEAPLDDVERTIAHIFAEVLRSEPVGRNDEFFLIGGDSLSAVELQLRVRQAFGIHAGVFHDGATVAGIAAEIRRAARDPAPQSRPIPVLIPLWQSGTETPLFIVHGRHGQAFVGPHFMKLLGNDQPVWAFQARGLDGLREPHVSVEGMAAEYLAELRARRPHGPYFLASLCAGVYILTIMARALRDAGEDVLPLLLLDPPSTWRQPGYSQMTVGTFVSKMKARRARGITAGRMDDPSYVKALLHTVMAFERALSVHRPLPYGGRAYVLSSRPRAAAAGSDVLRQLFPGELERYEVGSSHAEVFDPRNPDFASALLRCVGSIREGAHRRVSAAPPSSSP